MSQLIVSVSPHLRSKTTTQNVMLDVLIALCPTLIAAVIIFGFRALLVVAVTVAACVLSEWAMEKLLKRPNTLADLSAVVTGVILAFNLPASVPLWQAAIGAIFAIVVVKQLFGGLGHNFANPAITGRIFMFLAFSKAMAATAAPVLADAVSGATPLAIMSGLSGEMPSLLKCFLGMHSGAIGETCSLTLILGCVYMLCRRVITWHAPVAFIGTVALFSWAVGRAPLYEVLSGGLLIGAIFMATDYVTTPATWSGRLIFGVGCGLITMLIRVWGNYPEGVSFAILLMNILTPFIEKWTRSKVLGGVKA
ncbi:MAG: RnfABCDGE type electron transport complex subunit D [Oscillospiraceae bacterium]|nr:RnfABCDGE type electron transport complex subunit D [Oscillospiraceae bacterium]